MLRKTGRIAKMHQFAILYLVPVAFLAVALVNAIRSVKKAKP
jgi:hypothetical protein